MIRLCLIKAWQVLRERRLNGRVPWLGDAVSGRAVGAGEGSGAGEELWPRPTLEVIPRFKNALH